MTDMITEEKVYTERQKEEGRLLIKEAGIELAVVAFICGGGLCAIIGGIVGSLSLPVCVMAGGVMLSILCGIVFASLKQICRGVYKLSVFFGTLPFVGALGYCIFDRTIPHIKYQIYGYKLGWLFSFVITLVMGFMLMHYLLTVFLTYFKLYQSEDVDAYLGKSTSTGLL